MKYYVVGFISTLALLILTDKILLNNSGKEYLYVAYAYRIIN